ncbi:hypothetical protein HanHA300_Chr16g0619931 [Helianthus annuus]|nr:hypothetical protein HanHA300_Chr16g0619931 [Helianthus annuus]KAJ0461312.1 hypothetical protein HanHA89_Chr16g0670851 [Helianthus annuus]KAJ0641745.1 hypothetical protein HanLR1_Chr16g0630601 [Helianthus annuus]KAJ0645625.1 hypothetical protein HanOQP8_Chr16g0625981 [Helianthus annuus]
MRYLIPCPSINPLRVYIDFTLVRGLDHNMLLVHGVSLSDEEKVGDLWHPENQMAPFTLLDLWVLLKF